MYAFVLDDSGSVGVRQLPDPDRGALAIVAMRAAGVCGTDVHLADGVLSAPALPMVLGHEGAGVVTYLPDGGAGGLSVGDRVVVFSAIVCGHCASCLSGHEEICTRSPGQLGFSRDGVFSDLVSVPVENLIRIPDAVSFETASVLGCAGLTAVHAVRTADLARHDLVVVTGSGGVSALTTQVAKNAGAEVIGVTRSSDRTDLLRRSGADHVVVLGRAGYHGLADQVRSIGRQASHVIDVVGSQASIAAALDIVRPTGTVLLVGATDDATSVSTFTLLRKQIRLVGSLAGSRRELALALDLAARGHLTVPIDRRLSLNDTAQALDQLRAGQVTGRNVITWNAPSLESDTKEFS